LNGFGLEIEEFAEMQILGLGKIGEFDES
jgi:hypothetical protein